MVLSKEFFAKNKDQLRVTVASMSSTIIKFKMSMFSFGLNQITYLGYITTQEGIKNDPKKVLGIMDLFWPTTTIEARALIDLVQYYRDMWPIRSHVLYPPKRGGQKP